MSSNTLIDKLKARYHKLDKIVRGIKAKEGYNPEQLVEYEDMLNEIADAYSTILIYEFQVEREDMLKVEIEVLREMNATLMGELNEFKMLMKLRHTGDLERHLYILDHLIDIHPDDIPDVEKVVEQLRAPETYEVLGKIRQIREARAGKPIQSTSPLNRKIMENISERISNHQQ